MADQMRDLQINPGGPAEEQELQIIPPEAQPGSPAYAGTGTATEPDYSKMGMGEVAGRALLSAPKSFATQIGNLGTAILHPIETAKTIGRVAYGAGSKLGVLGEQTPEAKSSNEAELNAILQDYATRYGSTAGFKKALATDPFSIGMDIATVAPGVGAGLRAASLPGLARAAQATRFLDPTQVAISTATKTLAAAPKVAGTVLGLESGTTPAIMRYAAQAGMATNPAVREAYQRFRSGAGDLGEISTAARNALEEMKTNANQNYMQGLNSIQQSFANQALPWNTIDNAVQEAERLVFPHGATPKSTPAVGTLQELKTLINSWKNDPPSAHTILGMNDLKQAIGELRYGPGAGGLSPVQRRVLDTAYNGVLNTINDADNAIMSQAGLSGQRISYAKLMEDWQRHLDTVNDWTKTMGLSSRTAEANRIGKLLSSTKKDQTRSILEQMAKTQAGEHLPYMIAGAATSAGPDLAHLIMSGALGAGAYNLLAHPFAIPAAAAVTALGSPQVVGGLAYGAGTAVRPLQYIKGSIPSVPTGVVEQARGIARGTSPISGIARQTPVRAAGTMDIVGQQIQEGRYAPERRGEMIEFDPSELGARPQRATGGKVNEGDIHERLVGRLMDLADKAKKTTQKSTEGLLEAPDEAIVHALKVADNVI